MSGRAAVQRAALADALADAGPDAPTLCDGWTAADLAAHVVIRERRPDTAPGALLSSGPLHDWTERVLRQTREGSAYDDLVAKVRHGGLVPLPGPVDDLVNLSEMFIHTEDVRRAQPGWQARELPPGTAAGLWRAVRASVALHARPSADETLVLVAPDGRQVRAGRGARQRTVRGDIPELALWAAGRRDQALVEVEG